jgi:formylglycine-generating enzyme required for sulfatase activity
MDRLALRLLQHELEEGRQPDSLTADPLGTLNAMLQALSCLAYAMQRNRGEGTLLTLSEAQKVRFGGSHTQPLSIDEALRLGLDAHLLERTKKTKTRKKRDKESETTEPISETESEPAFVFYHHLLQEYFAARRLLDLFRKGKLPTRRLRVAWQRWQFLPKRLAWGEPMDSPPVTGWEETAVMASSLAGKDTSAFVQAVARHNLPVAGRGLAAADPRRQELQAPAETLSQRLLHRQRNLWAHPRARLDAGLALGELGHPDLLPKPFECEEGVVWAIWPPLQSVPSGEFIFGSSPEDRQAAFDEETSQRTQSLPTFQIGRYPATNAEFRYFIQSGGYAQDRWWSPDGQAWKRGGPDAHTGAIEDWLKWQKYYQENDLADIAQRYRWTPQRFRYWQRMVKMTLEEATHQAQRQFERPFDRPAYWDDPELSAPGCPVVGVNWYEAEAYCNWLAHITQQPFALPSEMQWEKAARGTDGRTYPWGERFSAARCNTIEGHYLTTTPVGLYPSGCSPYGLFDCSGNVWEWTTSWYQAYRASSAQSEDFGEKYRVVRGGSWYVNRGVARCACRDRLVPGNFDVNVGFRVLSPG